MFHTFIANIPARGGRRHFLYDIIIYLNYRNVSSFFFFFIELNDEIVAYGLESSKNLYIDLKR